jgi:hypothetical protein
MNSEEERKGVRLVGLGFVAVVAIAGLVLMLTQTGKISGKAFDATVTGDITGIASGIEPHRYGPFMRTPYEACRALRSGNRHGLVPVWNGFYDPWNHIIECEDPLEKGNPYRRHRVELQLKYG